MEGEELKNYFQKFYRTKIDELIKEKRYIEFDTEESEENIIFSKDNVKIINIILKIFRIIY
jgi:hypothetical protein